MKRHFLFNTINNNNRFVYLFILFLIMGMGCENKDNGGGITTPEDIPDSDNPHSGILTGTKWRLLGFVNDLTGEMDEIDVSEETCQKCFLITFETDSTYSGFTASNTIMGLYSIEPSGTEINFLSMEGTEVVETEEGLKFKEALFKDKNAFDFSSEELKVYYDKNNYLRLKSIKNKTQ